MPSRAHPKPAVLQAFWLVCPRKGSTKLRSCELSLGPNAKEQDPARLPFLSATKFELGRPKSCRTARGLAVVLVIAIEKTRTAEDEHEDDDGFAADKTVRAAVAGGCA